MRSERRARDIKAPSSVHRGSERTTRGRNPGRPRRYICLQSALRARATCAHGRPGRAHQSGPYCRPRRVSRHLRSLGSMPRDPELDAALLAAARPGPHPNDGVEIAEETRATSRTLGRTEHKDRREPCEAGSADDQQHDSEQDVRRAENRPQPHDRARERKADHAGPHDAHQPGVLSSSLFDPLPALALAIHEVTPHFARPVLFTASPALFRQRTLRRAARSSALTKPTERACSFGSSHRAGSS